MRIPLIQHGSTLTVCSAKSQVMAHSTFLSKGHVDQPPSPFAELKLTQGFEVSRRRYTRLGRPSAQVEWGRLFQDPKQPLIVDVGCGAGRCLLLMATQQTKHEQHVCPQQAQHEQHVKEHSNPIPASFQSQNLALQGDDCAWDPPSTSLSSTRIRESTASMRDGPACNLSTHHVAQSLGKSPNFLGIDVGVGLIDQANRWSHERGLSHLLQYLSADASDVLQHLRDYPGPIQAIAVQFPDPHYRPHRHVVTPAFVAHCVQLLPRNGIVLLQSDIESTALAMRDMFYQFGNSSFEPHCSHFEHGSASSTGGSKSSGETADAWSRHHSYMENYGRTLSNQHHNRAIDAEPSYDRCPLTIECNWKHAGWLKCTPFGFLTEREMYHEHVTKAPVYRLLLQRK